MPPKTPWLNYLPVISAIVIAISGYAALNSTVAGHTVEISDIKKALGKHALAVNKLDTFELMIDANSRSFDKFLNRFDEFLATQVRMNNQLTKLNAQLNTRQEMILKILEKK